MRLVLSCIVLGIVAIATLSAFAQESPLKPCKEHPQVSAQCFTVAGRARFYNGNPPIRIWPVGTTRLLGVSQEKYWKEGYANFPPDIAKLLTRENSVWGDFEVCPFEPDHPGVMRLVCVQSVRNIRVKNDK